MFRIKTTCIQMINFKFSIYCCQRNINRGCCCCGMCLAISGVSAVLWVLRVRVVGVGRLSPDFLCRLQSSADQVGAQVEETHLGIRNVGNGVESAQDGVLGLVSQGSGQQSPGTKTTQGSQQWGILTIFT